MREILFRGKRKDTGEWIEGYCVLLQDPIGCKSCRIYTGDYERHCGCIEPEYHEIDPATVGRDTGLTDRNSTKIYEGDIVEFKHDGEFDAKGIYFRKYAVEFVNTFVTYGLRLRNRSVHFPFKQATATTHDVVIVGNIYDNPELLEVCDEQSEPM